MKEYHTEKGKVIAVDFDGTLSFGQWPEVGPPNDKLVRFLQDRQGLGDKLILWTCRVGKELTMAVEWCKQQGLTFDAVNDNLPEVIDLYGSNSRKVSCDYYIDDKAILAQDAEHWKMIDQRIKVTE